MAQTARIRVVIVDDHTVLRSGLRAVIDRQEDMCVVAEASAAREGVGKVRECRPDVLLMDLHMPGGGVIEAIRALSALRHSPRIVVFTAYDDPTDAALAFRAGAHGFLVKRASSEELLGAIRDVHAGKRYVDPAVGGEAQIVPALESAPEDRPSGVRLSQRESQVLELTALGYSNKEVAALLGVGVRSVETYRLRLSDKLNLRSRAELARYAFHAGLLVGHGSIRRK